MTTRTPDLPNPPLGGFVAVFHLTPPFKRALSRSPIQPSHRPIIAHSLNAWASTWVVSLDLCKSG